MMTEHILGRLLHIYPHIRHLILNDLLPSETSALCIVVHLKLDEYDKKSFLNPADEVFISERVLPSVVITILIGNDVRLLPNVQRPGIELHALLRMADEDVDKLPTDGSGLINCTRTVARGTENLGTSNFVPHIPKDREIYLSITDCFDRDALNETAYRVFELTMIKSGKLYGWIGGDATTSSWDYSVPCVVCKSKSWRFDKVLIYVHAYYASINSLTDPTADVTVSIPLMEGSYTISDTYDLAV